jgi:hypothetical protein
LTRLKLDRAGEIAFSCGVACMGGCGGLLRDASNEPGP